LLLDKSARTQVI